MLVKVSSSTDDRVHLWNYEKFKEHHNARVKSWNSNGNLINFIVYDIDGKIDMELTNSLGLKCEIYSKSS